MAVETLSASDQEDLRQLLESDPAPSLQVRTEQAVLRGIMSYLGGGGTASSRSIPLNHRYEMRTDAIIAYAHLLSLASQLSAKWKIKCRNPQKAAAVDQSLQRIYGSFVLQTSEARHFGWQAMVTEFEDIYPDWEYIDGVGEERQVKKVWDEGNIPMKTWAPCVQLRPETVAPHWSAAGRFAGIELGTVGPWSFPTTLISSVSNGTSTVKEVVPVERSLWIVHNRHGEFGSAWGSPRTQNVYKFWKAYEAILAVINTAVQRKGDPLWIVLYPDGSTPWGADGAVLPNQVVAKLIARQARSGAVLTMPSEMFEKDAGGARKWDIVPVKFEDTLDKLLEIAKYLDIMKFRAMFISELSVAEGSGGSSSRNVAAVTGTKSDTLQFAAQLELDEQINRYLIPTYCDVNFPELRADPIEKVTLAFGDDEAQLLAELLKSRANANPDALPVDWVKGLERFNIDTTDPQSILNAEKRLVEEAKNRVVPPTPAGAQESGTQKETGFYYPPSEHIYLTSSRNNARLINSLPPIRPFQDMAIINDMLSVQAAWGSLLSDQYEDLARFIERDESEVDEVGLADEKSTPKQIAERIVRSWRFDGKRVEGVVTRTKAALSSIFSRAFEVETKSAGLEVPEKWDPSKGRAGKWIDNNTGRLIKGVEKTTKDQLTTYLADALKTDKSAKQIADGVRAHFSEFPSWRADLIARQETTSFYRAATLFAAEAQGKKVQAIDARLGEHRSDKKCIDRNGRLMDVVAGWRAHEEEHPRGTLAFRIVRTDLSVEYVGREEQPDVAARIDKERGVVHLRDDLDGEDEGRYLIQAVDWIEATAP
jgi:hypothetical protein